MDLTPVYEALSKGPAEAFFNAHREYVRKEVAEAAREDMRQAARQGRADIMYLAATTAAWIYLQLGDRPEFLTNRLDALQALFMISDTETEYDSVREQALELHKMARSISAQQMMFDCLVLAADCSWFSAEAAKTRQDTKGSADRLERTLDDVLAALRAAGPVARDRSAPVWVERLASILAVSANAAMSAVGGWNYQQTDTGRLEGQLRQLAAAADVLPVDMRFEGHEAGKASNVAVVLERLESEFG
jgi:hypothetical protein